jgi:formylglycine-generating enzyme required for sulfatase activity
MGRRLHSCRPFFKQTADSANQILMRTLFVFLWAIITALSAFAQKQANNMVLVEGGPFKNTNSANYYGKGVNISNFYIGKYEVTQKEWMEVMGNNPSKFKGDNLPVEMVSWYDCADYCNKRSLIEGFKPYYNIEKDTKDLNNTNHLDDVKWMVTINIDANGYRLPTDAEWEYAAGGGKISKSYAYSGNNDLEKVGWYWRNSGDKYLTASWYWPTLEKNNNQAKPVGSKEANELGLYDMSGNVREWCWEWFGDLQRSSNGDSDRERLWKGGCWMGAEYCCKVAFRGSHQANGKGPDQGLRVCRSQSAAQD